MYIIPPRRIKQGQETCSASCMILIFKNAIKNLKHHIKYSKIS